MNHHKVESSSIKVISFDRISAKKKFVRVRNIFLSTIWNQVRRESTKITGICHK